MPATLAPSRSSLNWRDLSVPIGLSLVAIAALVLWSLSPSLHHYLHLAPPSAHGQHDADRPSTLTLISLFSAAWLLMTVAHMLPTATPLLTAFRAVARRRRAFGLLLGALITGFLTAWAAAGIIVAVIHSGLLWIIEGYGLQAANPWLLAVTLGLAGNYQLSNYVDKCLYACRAPMSFIGPRWRGGKGVAWQALGIGLDYGRSCLGCCAALMVVMFVLGAASHAWMVGFALVSVLQKSASWGHRLTRPLGIGFLVAAFGVAVTTVV